MSDIGCELLSNHYLCANKNSQWALQTIGNIVVNCFQIIIFVLTRTALSFKIILYVLL